MQTNSSSWFADRRVILGLAITCAIVAGFVLSDSRLLNARASSTKLGLGRELVYTTSGADVRATMRVPAGVSANEIRWTLKGSGLDLDGEGAVVAFTAPKSGNLTLTATAQVGLGKETTTTTFSVVPAGQAPAAELSTAGRVTVDGAPAVQGEALLDGMRVDSTGARVSMRVHATVDGAVNGLISLQGTDFTVASRQVDGDRVLNTFTVNSKSGKTKVLRADVEHLDGVRYVAVQTPDAVAMVKGTAFVTTVNDEGSDITVDHGVVRIMDRHRKRVETQDLTAGMRAAVKTPDQGAVIDPNEGSGGNTEESGSSPQGTMDDGLLGTDDNDAVDRLMYEDDPVTGDKLLVGPADDPKFADRPAIGEKKWLPIPDPAATHGPTGGSDNENGSGGKGPNAGKQPQQGTQPNDGGNPGTKPGSKPGTQPGTQAGEPAPGNENPNGRPNSGSGKNPNTTRPQDPYAGRPKPPMGTQPSTGTPQLPLNPKPPTTQYPTQPKYPTAPTGTAPIIKNPTPVYTSPTGTLIDPNKTYTSPTGTFTSPTNTTTSPSGTINYPNAPLNSPVPDATKTTSG